MELQGRERTSEARIEISYTSNSIDVYNENGNTGTTPFGTAEGRGYVQCSTIIQ